MNFNKIKHHKSGIDKKEMRFRIGKYFINKKGIGKFEILKLKNEIEIIEKL